MAGTGRDQDRSESCFTTIRATLKQVTYQARIIAYIDDFKLMLVLALMVLPLLLLVRTVRSR
jgi:hypothetical protein